MDPHPPDDVEQRNIIDKLAQFVARNGSQFEQMTKAKQMGNPRFAFLFGGDHNAYYQFRVAIEQAKMKAEEVQQQQQQQPPPPPHLPLPPGPSMGFVAGPPPPFYHPNAPPAMFAVGPGGPSLPLPGSPMFAVGPGAPPMPQNSPMFPVGPPPPSHYLPPSFPSQPAAAPSQPSVFVPFHNSPQLPPPPPASSTQGFNHHHPHHYHPHDQVPLQPTPETLAKIENLKSQITDSERNLGEQLKLIEQEEEQLATKTVDKGLEDELKRMCEDYSINLKEFDKLLVVIEDCCRKESIACGKSWIFAHCFVNEHCEAVAKHLLRKITRGELSFEARLHLIYLINELYSDCIRKNDGKLREALDSIIVPIFCTVRLMAPEEKMPKLNKLLKIWEFNQYFEPSVLDRLRDPEASLEAYQASLLQRFEDSLNKSKTDLRKRRESLENMHATFAKHVGGQIQALKPQASMPTTTNPVPTPQQLAQLPPGMFPNLPPPMFQADLPRPPAPTDVAGRATLAFGGHHNFYGGNGPPLPGLPGPPNMFGLPPPGLFPPGGPFGPPAFGPNMSMQPPTEMSQSSQEPRAPYFDLPAGIMTMMVDIDQFGYKPIETSKIRMPLVPPNADDRLLQALDAFYAPVSHANPRNADGWEQLGLYEFNKRKSQARKFYEAKHGSIEMAKKKEQVSDAKNDNEAPEKENVAEIVADKKEDSVKRKFKQFKEEKEESDEIRSNPGASRDRKESRSKRSSSRSRSRSRSPSKHQHLYRTISNSGSKGRRRSRSRSPEEASTYRSSKRKSRSISPPSMTKGLGSSGAAGSATHTQLFPPSPPPVPELPSLGLYAGVGATPVTPGQADPFESYRRNKGAAYIRRIRDGRQ